MIWMTALFVVTGAILVGLSIPLIRRRVKPNPWYGVRVRATYADEWVWYEANAASGRDLLAVGMLVVVLALALPAAGLDEEAYALTLCAVSTAGALGAALVGIVRANRLLAERRAGEPSI